MRKRLEYPADTSPTPSGASGDLLREILVPVPEGVGLDDLEILSELCDDLLLTAEDAAEILETLGVSSARPPDGAMHVYVVRTRFMSSRSD